VCFPVDVNFYDILAWVIVTWCRCLNSMHHIIAIVEYALRGTPQLNRGLFIIFTSWWGRFFLDNRKVTNACFVLAHTWLTCLNKHICFYKFSSICLRSFFSIIEYLVYKSILLLATLFLFIVLINMSIEVWLPFLQRLVPRKMILGIKYLI
jgi:hypothetical protein